MKKTSLLLTLVMILTLVATLSVQAVVDTTTFYSKLSDFKNQRYAHNSIYKDNPSLTGGYQCFGYANELALYIWGSYPTKSMSAKTVNSGWEVTYGGSAVDNLCVGDIVRYRYHSIFITGISGDTIYYCHANSPSGTNKVTYDNTISRSTLKSRVSEKLTSPNTTKTGWVAHFIQNVCGSGQVVDMSESTSNSNNALSNTSSVSSVKISPNSYPSGNLKYGNDFTLTAKFTSDCAIVEARAYMLDSNKNVIMEAKGSSTTGNYYVEGYALDKGMKFNELSPGGYYLKYYVKDANGDTNTWISDKFYIVKEEEKPVVDMSTIDNGTQATPEPDSTLNINLTNCPSSIENGESILLTGTISSNYLIKEAKVVIFASNGIGHFPTTIYPNSKSVRIENTDLSDGIYFEGLPGGTYRITITAKDEKTTKEITKNLKISERKTNVNVYFELNGGENGPITRTVTQNSSFVVPFQDPYRLGYTFLGWDTDYRSNNPEYKAGDTINIGDSNLVLYAVWDETGIPFSLELIEHSVQSDDLEVIEYYVDGDRFWVDDIVFNCDENIYCNWGMTESEDGYFSIVLYIHKWGEIASNEFSFDVVNEDGVVLFTDTVLVFEDYEKTEDELFPDRNPSCISVYLNGEKLYFDVPPQTINDRTMVPMRAIFEALGAMVGWDEETQTASGETDDCFVQISIGKDYLLRNGEFIGLDSPAVVISDRTLVPVRAISESMNCIVNWYEEEQVVEIIKDDF